MDFEEAYRTLTRRYHGISLDALVAVMCPLLVPIRSIDKTISRVGSLWRASFTVDITEENQLVVQRGRTGKFVPASYQAGGTWSEIAKGRFTDLDRATGIAHGEIYCGGTKSELESSVEILSEDDYLEIDQFGAAAKILSALAEHSLVQKCNEEGFFAHRLPEDMARHLGAYENCDFIFEKNGETRRVEVKSLWGTNTRKARLIHSTTTRPSGPEEAWTEAQRKNYYPTSSCKYTTQDVFAVSLFLRTGNINDFAFARSVPSDEAPYGLPRSPGNPNHVHQNPLCTIDNQVWFASLEDVWDLP